MADDGFTGSRKVYERGGSLTVCIPTAIVDRYDIEKGDNVFWTDSEEEKPRLLPAGVV